MPIDTAPVSSLTPRGWSSSVQIGAKWGDVLLGLENIVKSIFLGAYRFFPHSSRSQFVWHKLIMWAKNLLRKKNIIIHFVLFSFSQRELKLNTFSISFSLKWTLQCIQKLYFSRAIRSFSVLFLILFCFLAVSHCKKKNRIYGDLIQICVSKSDRDLF